MNNNKSVPKTSPLKKIFHEIIDPFVHFIKAPRALWGINIPYVIEGLVYFGILTILGKYCSENVALSDLHAGWVYGFVTGGITFAMLLFGGVSDKIGVRNSLILSLSMMLVGRTFISISGTIPMGQGLGSPMFLNMIFGLFIMVIAYGLYQPAAYAGVKRYTNPQTAAMGYAVIYGLMNLGAFFSGFVSSNTRHVFESIFPPNGLTAVFWIYTILTLLAVLTTVFILTKKTDQRAVERVGLEKSAGNESEEGSKDKPQEEMKKKINNIPFVSYTIVAAIFLAFFLSRIFSSKSSNTEGINNIYLILSVVIFGVIAIWEFLRKRPEHPFRDVRFVFFISILFPVQTLFAHTWLTIPYYLDRAFAGTIVSEYFEVFSNINPILIFIFAPIIAAVTTKTNVYKMMIVGTFVMAAPTFLLALGPNTYLLLTYIVLMTIGEAMWQPRFLQWIAEIAPEGKTGAYMGIGQLPWFLTKLITATYSGWFLMKYCPVNTPPEQLNTETMWFIYGLIAMVSPVALFLAKGWMGKHMSDKLNKAHTN
jgi:MFS family permease